MGKFANERAWQESRAWAEPEPQEPLTDDEFEIGYSEYDWDKQDAAPRSVRLWDEMGVGR